MFRIGPGIGQKKKKKRFQAVISSHRCTECFESTVRRISGSVIELHSESSTPYSLTSIEMIIFLTMFSVHPLVTDYSSERLPRLDWAPGLTDRWEPARVVRELRPHSDKGTVLLNRAEVCFHLCVSVKMVPAARFRRQPTRHLNDYQGKFSL